MSAVDWIPLDGTAVQVGDLVSAEAGGMPIYRVVAVNEGEAWLQEDRHPAVLMSTARLHWKAIGRAAQPQAR